MSLTPTHTRTHARTHARVKETIEVIITGTNETHSKCGVRGSILNTWMFYINYMDVFGNYRVFRNSYKLLSYITNYMNYLKVA